MTPQRCGWCSDDPLYITYHDQEWGKPEYDEQRLFEMLCLEGQQAGLSWITVLKKRQAYRQHFFQYPIAKIAGLSDELLQQKMQDSGLIRHLGKLKAIRDNAVAWQKLKAEVGDVGLWLWQVVDGQPLYRNVTDFRQAPAQTETSLALSKTLKKYGFKFVGPTTCYAFMQAVGMVDDHENSCKFKSKPNIRFSAKELL
ncbi:DNA-3-methyladenine glycosylase I [Acinetobacter radioresistens]|uniref:DNA-3-methyladenine glycosylase I n=1 Tax=Acinetobacter radioresistens TaxID=40216 RepID=UPI000555BAD7|nr:DNA-3-methyladenine glycosylase I [Acinetobacter radioresistens]MCK4107992.1 DNA-3-methyladenine glycosylase I [Acinetobacter radioresistens]MCX0329587.1 DNA-3-methyladenine glycosylase I [Acinetobacter radioresistens]MDK8755396.1 DNA-3-methyladenine glycosylase I [Acinetobacter radioresistens]